MAPKTAPPRSGGVGSVPDSGNPKVPVPATIQFDDDDRGQRKSKLIRNQKSKAQAKRGFFSWLFGLITRFGILYTLYSALWTCPSHPFNFDYKLKDSRSQCRAIAHSKAQLQPIVSPYVQAAQTKIDPYTRPYIQAASPYARSAVKTAKPYYRYASKQSRLAYNRHVEPARKLAVKRGRQYVDPHIKEASKHYSKHVQPHVDTAQRAIKPWQDVYRRDVSPYLQQAYIQSLAFGSASYGVYVSRVHPLVVRSLHETHAFYVNHFDPAVRRAYALYIRPQVDRALSKMFGHRARAASSDALREVRKEIKQTKTEAKELEKEKVAEAKASATRAQEDPSLVDRLKQAKDQVVGGPLAAADPVASAASDAEREVEASSTKEQLEAWEKGLGNLIEQEYKLTLQRVDEIRKRFADGLDERIDVMSEDVEVEVEGIFARLDKAFTKLQKSDSEDRVEVGRATAEKQRSKLERSRLKVVSSIGAVYDELQSEEHNAQRLSVAQVQRYIVEAQEAYVKLTDNAKFDETRQAWKDWDNGIGVRSRLFDEELTAVRKGDKKVAKGVVGIDTGLEGDIQRRLATAERQIDALYDAALAELGSYASTEVSRLGGSDASSAAGKILESTAEGAQQLSDDGRAVIAEAAAGIGGTAQTNVASILSSRASTMSASASSAAIQASASASYIVDQGAKSASIKSGGDSPIEQVEGFVKAASEGIAGFGETASSSASSALRQASRSAGLNPTPESFDEHVEGAAGFVTDGAAAVVAEAAATAGLAGEAASSMFRHGTRSVASAAGAKVTPETPEDYFDSMQEAATTAYEGISSAGQRVYDSLSGDAIVEPVSSALHDATRSVASAAGIKPTPETVSEYFEQGQEYVESVFSAGQGAASQAAFDAAGAAHSATRSLSSVVGAKPTPETAAEYVEAVGDAAGSVADSASSAVFGESNVADRAASAASSLGSSASSAAHEASKTVVRAAGGTPQPEGAAEHIESVVEQAKDAGTAFTEAVRNHVEL